MGGVRISLPPPHKNHDNGMMYNVYVHTFLSPLLSLKSLLLLLKLTNERLINTNTN